MNQKGFINIAIIIGVIILVGIAGYFVVNRQTPSPEPTPSPNPPSTSSPSLNNNCEGLVSYSVRAYQDGWEKTFKKENNLSDSQFNTYITVTAISLQPVGNTCELAVRYTIKKDWLVVNQVDDMTLGVPPTISPDNLPLESDPTKPGRIGVSNVNLHDPLSFKNQTEAMNFFVDKYNLKGIGAKIQKQGFQYFWNKEGAEKSGYPFAGEGGEAFISVSGTINSSQNKCYSGELSLVSKETTYHDTPCRIN
ncbi:MAG: hypothetical protein AAB491_01465 [Patescibacteria group bacterium]